VERANPIPAGTYWIDIVDSNLAPVNLQGFNGWAKANAPHVKILKKELKVKGGPFDLAKTQVMWTLFRLDQAVPRWPTSVAIGLPTLAAKGDATKPADTETRQKEKSVLEYWGLPDLPPAALGMLAVVAILAMRRK
jgi:hypothetical protein